MKKLFLCLLVFIIGCKPMPDNMIEQSSNESWMLAPFKKRQDVNPVIKPDATTRFICPVRKSELAWEEKDAFNPAAIVKDGKVYLLYRAEDKVGTFAGTSRIGLAESEDGIHFKRLPQPVIYPDNDSLKQYEWEGGCEDPRIVEREDGTYIVTYTAFNGELARLCIATSKDLIKWDKHGLAFGKANNGAYRNLWSKSGSIVCKIQNNRLIATKIDGKYWMYWGESEIFIATSDDCIDWQPLERSEPLTKKLKYLGDSKYESIFGDIRTAFLPAFCVRKGRFDSGLIEPGPPAVLTDKGILFLYNGANKAGGDGDPSLPAGSYSGGQVLLDAKDPTVVINRCSESFFKADSKLENQGQTSNVCFLEGLVFFKGKWLLYYGMADSNVGVAECESPLFNQ